MALWNKKKKTKSIVFREENGFKLDLTTEECFAKIDLRRNEVNNIREKITALKGIKSRVALVLDYSNSMSKLYKDGTIQSFIERLLPIACEFDDNQELDLWIFENSFKRLGQISLKNFPNYVKKNITSKYGMGGTSYSPVLNDVINYYTIENISEIPNYIIFITDGDAADKQKAEDIIKQSSNLPIFWQYIGLGNNSFKFLQRISESQYKDINNTSFFKIADVNSINDFDLYNNLLNKYPTWLNNYSHTL